jgi:hypothetical protein
MSIYPTPSDRQRIAQARENLIDFDTVVDDARRELDAALDRLRAAVAARDAEAQRLADLIQRLAA